MVGSFAGAQVKATVDMELEPRSSVKLAVITGSGTIRVRHTRAGVFHLRASTTVRAPTQAQADSLMDAVRREPPVEDRGEEVIVGDLQKYGLSALANLSVVIDFDIEAPYDTALRLKSGSGSQHVGALRGPVQVRAGSGEVVIDDVAQAVEVSSGSGNLTVRRVHALQARTGSGSLTLQDVAGRTEVRTGSGRIAVASVGGDLVVNSGSGRVQVASALPPGARWRLKTASGSIDVQLPQDSSFALTAKTASGRLAVKFPLTSSSKKGGEQLEGQTDASPKASLELQTASGRIHLRKQGEASS